MRTYLDTSFLVSLYSVDANSVTAAQVMQSSTGDHIVSTFAELEFVNALQLRIFRKELTPTAVNASVRLFEEDLQAGVLQLVSLPQQAFERARQLSMQTTAQYGVRTADLIHIAVALELQSQAMYSFDQQQRKLARSLHLQLN